MLQAKTTEDAIEMNDLHFAETKLTINDFQAMLEEDSWVAVK